MNNPSPDDLAFFMKSYLVDNGSLPSGAEINSSTDLVALGVESIQLLSLLSIVEKRFNLSISIEKLEKHCFSFSADTLLDIVV